MSRRLSVALLAIVLSFAVVTAARQSPVTGRDRWPPGATIRVWIGPASVQRDDPALVERAMATWTAAGAGRFTLARTKDEKGADIRVRFATGDTRFGEASPLVDRRTGHIVSADVAIAENVGGEPLIHQIVIYLTAVHELGHALGLAHTDAFDDIMYLFRRPDDAERYFGAYRERVRGANDIGSARATGLSARDVATLRALYRD